MKVERFRISNVRESDRMSSPNTPASRGSLNTTLEPFWERLNRDSKVYELQSQIKKSSLDINPDGPTLLPPIQFRKEAKTSENDWWMNQTPKLLHPVVPLKPVNESPNFFLSPSYSSPPVISFTPPSIFGDSSGGSTPKLENSTVDKSTVDKGTVGLKSPFEGKNDTSTKIELATSILSLSPPLWSLEGNSFQNEGVVAGLQEFGFNSPEQENDHLKVAKIRRSMRLTSFSDALDESPASMYSPRSENITPKVPRAALPKTSFPKTRIPKAKNKIQKMTAKKLVTIFKTKKQLQIAIKMNKPMVFRHHSPMPPKQKHPKQSVKQPKQPIQEDTKSTRSTTGCWTCRVRHKGCTQERPVCHHCKRLELTCDYSVTRPSYMVNSSRLRKKKAEIRTITDKLKGRNLKINALKKRDLNAPNCPINSVVKRTSTTKATTRHPKKRY